MKGETLWIVVGVGCLVVIVLGLFGAGGAAVYMLRTGDELGVPVPPMPTPVGRDPIAPTAPPAPAPPPTTTVPFAIGAPPEPAVRLVRATVTASSGLADVTVGTPCTVEVRRSDDSDQCHAQIDCGPRHLYGSESLGFFTCTLFVGGTRPDIQGADAMTTREDTDPAMSLDTVAGVLTLRDDETGTLGAFSVSANVESVAFAQGSR
jgi:hypothetical protein